MHIPGCQKNGAFHIGIQKNRAIHIEDQPAHPQSDQGLHSPLTESLDAAMYEWRTKAWMILWACAGSESAHFAHV